MTSDQSNLQFLRQELSIFVVHNKSFGPSVSEKIFKGLTNQKQSTHGDNVSALKHCHHGCFASARSR
jgi:hypothetical protein